MLWKTPFHWLFSVALTEVSLSLSLSEREEASSESAVELASAGDSEEECVGVGVGVGVGVAVEAANMSDSSKASNTELHEVSTPAAHTGAYIQHSRLAHPAAAQAGP
jgi:hypothetical protein